jgi:hypothetical protein
MKIKFNEVKPKNHLETWKTEPEEGMKLDLVST